MNSLKFRLLLACSLLLLSGLSFTGWTLHNINNNYNAQTEYDRLQSIVYMLLSAFEVDEQDGVIIDDDLIREIRLLQPESGLVAMISSNNSLVWESTSMTRAASTIDEMPLTDEWQFKRDHTQASLSYGYEWINNTDNVSRYAISVRDSASPLLAQQQEFSRTLWRSLTMIGLALLLLMYLLLWWGLAPLRKIRSELSHIKQGQAEELTNLFPTEILPLTNSINRFIGHERKQIARFRNSLADLAHSLKTPLAVIKADPQVSDHPQVIAQVDQLDKIIHHQLSRAAVSGRRLLAEPVEIKPAANKVIAALQKVYANKNIEYRNQLSNDFKISINPDDLTEVLGILLDNASKYGATQITLSNQGTNQLIIDDNGPGLTAEDFDQLMQRGIRGDTLESGSGIGLAIALDIIEANSGTLNRVNKQNPGLKLALTFIK